MPGSDHNGPYSRISATTSIIATTPSDKATPKLTVAPATSATHRLCIVNSQTRIVASALIVGWAVRGDHPGTGSIHAANQPRFAWVVVASQAPATPAYRAWGSTALPALMGRIGLPVSLPAGTLHPAGGPIGWQDSG